MSGLNSKLAEILWSVFSGLLHQHAAQSLKTVKVEFFSWEEGLCVQCMHIGPYDDEPATVAAMEEYAREQGYELDFSQGRFHHEIYLSDARRTKPERLKTVIRQPVRRIP